MISLERAMRRAARIFELREKGASQQEVSTQLGLERTFISRLETLGEIRKGTRAAVIAFPLSNTGEITALCEQYGLDYHLIMTNSERWALVEGRQALDLFNWAFELIGRLRDFDSVVMVTSEKWFRIAEALLEAPPIHIDLGTTPIEADCYLDPERLRVILDRVIESPGISGEEK